jgi:hypothetical protein
MSRSTFSVLFYVNRGKEKIPFYEITIQGNKNLLSAELAHQKADKHLCVVLHRKVRIRLHPSTALQTEIFAE